MTKKQITVLIAIAAIMALTFSMKAVVANDDVTTNRDKSPAMTVDLTNTTRVLLETTFGEIELAPFSPIISA